MQLRRGGRRIAFYSCITFHENVHINQIDICLLLWYHQGRVHLLGLWLHMYTMRLACVQTRWEFHTTVCIQNYNCCYDWLYRCVCNIGDRPTLVNTVYQEYIILGVYNGLLYIMKRQVNSSIVLWTMDFLICISTSLINFVAAPPGQIYLFYR
jgi:hypothetical protein